jgi:lipoate-protein ligase A
MLNGKKVVGASQRRKNGVLLHQSALFFKEDPEGLVVRLADGFCREWGLDLKVQNWSEEERRRIKTVAERRYELPEWIYPLADASTKSV